MRKLILWIALCLCLISFPAFATDYYVDDSASDDTGAGTLGDPKKTIQAGINLAASGDTVWVADGTYTGTGNVNLDFGGAPNDFTVRAANILGAVIDGEESNVRGFYFHNSETNDSTIKGFVIEHCYLASDGAGIKISEASPTITHCWIRNNKATGGGGNGGAIRAGGGGANPIINFCLCTGNYAEQLGGGFFLAGNATGSTIENTLITGNSTGDNYSGIYFAKSATIANVIIYGNDIEGIVNENVMVDCTPTYSLYDFDKTANDTPDPGGSCLDGGSVDPLLADAFTLKPSSPCINAGTKAGNAGLAGFQTDINGGTYYFTPYDRMNMGADQTFSDADARPVGKGRIISGILR